MTVERYQEMFWESIPDLEDQNLFSRINERLKEMYYQVGLKRVKALENIEDLVTKDSVYKVHLVKDEHFPDGEEAIVTDSGEYMTLLCFRSDLYESYS
ncbi:MAG: hypothetical protein AAF849_17910 [Bacteroidota bacterium]